MPDWMVPFTFRFRALINTLPANICASPLETSGDVTVLTWLLAASLALAMLEYNARGRPPMCWKLPPLRTKSPPPVTEREPLVIEPLINVLPVPESISTSPDTLEISPSSTTWLTWSSPDVGCSAVIITCGSPEAAVTERLKLTDPAPRLLSEIFSLIASPSAASVLTSISLKKIRPPGSSGITISLKRSELGDRLMISTVTSPGAIKVPAP